MENLFTNVPVQVSIDIIRRKLEKDNTLSERTDLPVTGILELLSDSLENSYFQLGDNFYIQKDGLPMGSPLSPAVANIFMNWFEEKAIKKAQNKPKLWLRYVDDTFIIWNHGDRLLRNFFENINKFLPP